MKNLNKILTLGAGAVVMLASCTTSYNAMRGDVTDPLYFSASDARVATEFAVANNTPQTFQSLNSTETNQVDQENFSARNVNPEYIARYQTQNTTDEEGTVYFDDSEGGATDPNVNAYNNYYGNAGGGFGPGMGRTNINFNMGMGMGFGGFGGFGMPMWGMPMWGNPFMMGGFYDPFFDPFWGSRMSMGFGFGGFGMRPWGFNRGFGMGFGMGYGMGFGMGFGNPWMMNRFGWGNPMWGGGFYGGPGLLVVNNNFGNERNQVVRGARPGRGAGTGVGAAGIPSTTRAARRDAATGSRALNSGTSRNAARDFGRSQNDIYNGSNSRVANASARPGVRNTGSAAATRPSSRTGINNARPAYGASPNARTTNRGGYATPSRGNTQYRGAPSGRTSSPSYNRSSSPSRGGMSPSRGGMSPSRGNTSAPSRMSSPSPSRGGGGGYSGGGGSRGGGGGMSSGGGSRGGGRGN